MEKVVSISSSYIISEDPKYKILEEINNEPKIRNMGLIINCQVKYVSNLQLQLKYREMLFFQVPVVYKN